MGKLQRIHVLAIAVVLIAGLAAVALLVLVKPRQGKLKNLAKKIEEEEKVAVQRTKKQKQLDEARAEHAAAVLRWENIMDEKMSHVSLRDQHKAMFELNAEYQSDIYRKTLQRDLNMDPNVRLMSRLNFPSSFGWSLPSRNMEMREFKQGNMRFVVKNFPALLEWLENTGDFSRVLLFGDNITISGKTPNLSVTVPGTVYIYYPDAIATPVKASRAGGGGGGGGGGGRGGGGGGRTPFSRIGQSGGGFGGRR